MDTNEWDLMARLFEEALRLPIHKRADYLNNKCIGRTGLKNELLSLLSDHDAAQVFFREAFSFKGQGSEPPGEDESEPS